MKSSFQIVFVAIFIFAALLGLLVFSGVIDFGKKENKDARGKLVMWGTIRSSDMRYALGLLNSRSPYFSISYVQKYPETISNELLEALASGTAPDLFLLPNDLVLSYSNKIVPFTYAEYPLATFQNNFSSVGQVFLTSSGMLAYPLVVDPLMMYYNRTFLDSEGIINPPETWDELVEMVPIFTRKNINNEIQRSAVSFGQFTNVRNAKEIISALFLQIGNPIIENRSGKFYSVLFDRKYGGVDVLAPALSFYVAFANPLDPMYSWNISLPDSRDYFTSQRLVFYFGFASELRGIIDRNPNLNFLVAPIPQFQNSQFRATYAKVYGITVSTTSRNRIAAKSIAALMANSSFPQDLANSLGIAPARKDLLAKPVPENPFLPVFYNSALFARSWLDPNYFATNQVFRSMIEGLLSNISDSRIAVSNLNERLTLLIGK